MGRQEIQDNVYPVGATVQSKINPTVDLLISAYYNHIYYCKTISHPESKELALYEREIVPPKK
jgi:hypothetical protein